MGYKSFGQKSGAGQNNNFASALKTILSQPRTWIYWLNIGLLILGILTLCIYFVWQWVVGIGIGIIVTLILWCAYFVSDGDDLVTAIGAFALLAFSLGNIAAGFFIPWWYPIIFWCLTIIFFINNLILMIMNFLNSLCASGGAGAISVLLQIVSVIVFLFK